MKHTTNRKQSMKPQPERKPRFEFGVRDRVTGEQAWTELRSVRHAARALGLVLKYCQALAATAVAAGLLSGCTTFHVTQTDTSPDERIIKSEIKATAWFSSAQNVARIKAIQTDKTQSFGTDGLGQQGATNTTEALKAIAHILELLRPVP